MACSYIYNGKAYTEYQILKLIKQGDFRIGNPELARKWLRDKLGMSDDQIEIVKGLIDGRSVGRLLEDGKILLSDTMSEDTARHEAFHRVFRLFLTTSEREDIVAEFKSRKNWEASLKGIAELYPELSTDALIEEYLADEFMMYSMANGNYDLPQAPKRKGFFGWLLDMLKRLLNLSISDLYANIEAGKYSGTPTSIYTSEAESRIQFADDTTLDTELKQELYENISYKLLDDLFNNHEIYKVLNNKVSPAEITTKLRDIILASMKSLYGTNKDLVNKLMGEIFTKSDSGSIIFRASKDKMTSIFMKDLFKYFESLGIKSSIDKLEDEDLGEMSEDEQHIMKDYSFMKVSFEFDPKASVSKSIRLLMASLPDQRPSKKLKLDVAVPYNEVATVLFNELANTPANYTIFLEELNKLKSKYKWIETLLDRLKGNSVDYNVLKFRNEFIKAFAKNKYEFLVGKMRKGNIYHDSAIYNNLSDRVYQTFVNQAIIENGNIATLSKRLRASKSVEEDIEILGMSDLANFLDIPVLERGGKTVREVISGLTPVIHLQAEAGIGIQDIYRKPRGADLTDKQKKDLNIQGTVRILTEIVAEGKVPTDLMFYNSTGKKIYAISLNTYQTITANYLNWIGKKSISMEEKLKLMQEHLPHLLNPQTIEFKEDGTHVFKSSWLKRVLDGDAIKISIYDGIKGQQDKSFSDLNETDLYAFYLNSPISTNSKVSPVHIAIKHSDRSTIFAYKFEQPKEYIPHANMDAIMASGINILTAYAQEEYKLMQDKTKSLVKNYSGKKNNPQHFGFIKNWNDIEGEITKHVRSQVDKLFKSMSEYGLFREYNNKPVGIDGDVWSMFTQGMGSNKNAAIPAILARVYMNTFINRIEEQKLFLGDLRIYKNLDDAYKRFSMQSGTGDVQVDDELNSTFISNNNRRDVHEIYNPITGELVSNVYNKTPGYYTELVVDESENYNSELLQPYGETTLLEHGIVESMAPIIQKRLGVELEEAKKIATAQASKYAAKYEGYNENDGISYANIFSWREYEHRNATWTKEKENTFQLELAVLKIQDLSQLKNVEVYVDKNGRVTANPVQDAVIVKPFDMNDIQTVFGTKTKPVDPVKWYFDTFEPGNMLKPQYTGPVYRGLDNRNEFVIGGRKTSYAILFPSMIIGTNLQKLNAALIEKGIDFAHMTSATKYGYFDPKLVMQTNSDSFIAKNGSKLYKEDGEFNDELYTYADNLKSFLDVKYMKNQLEISNKSKDEIKNSTQSAKIIISNIMENGIPRDVTNDALWKQATETKKRELSPLYNLMRGYQETLNKYIKDNTKSLLEELQAVKDSGADTYTINQFQKLVDILLESANDRNSPVAVLEAIEMFSQSKVIETLSNKNRIENILFSLISNRVIKLKRPGDAKPQFAVTGFESGTRSFNSSALKFYQPILDSKGNIVKVEPAEIMLPLPKRMFKEMLERFDTSNIIDALEQYDQLPDEEKIVLKGLRIPNQQMSSNDVFRVKRFLPPTKESYVVLPSETVVKSGSDFDIDKLQMYFPQKGNDVHNKLLQYEIDILLHPTNFGYLVAPVVDDKLKVEILAEVEGELARGMSKADALKAAKDESLVSKSDLYDYTDIDKNIDKFVTYIATKAGVGQLATVITTHSVAQADNIELGKTVKINIEEDEEGTQTFEEIATELPFAGFENQYGLSLTMDSEAQQILESVSMLLTSQVDGAKNPYPKKLNITTQTLNIIGLLVRRGVPLHTIVKFIRQPLIMEYLKQQRINESELYQNTTGKNKLSLSRDNLIERVVKSASFNLSSYQENLTNARQALSKISIEELETGIRKNNVSHPDQIKMLAHFINLTDVSKAFGAFMRDMTPDTKTMKDMGAVESILQNYQEMLKSNIIANPEKYRNGMLKPFFDARELYQQLYIKLYFTRNPKYNTGLNTLYETFSKLQRKSDDKVKVINELENDFIVYVLQNNSQGFKQYSYDSLFKGENSLPKRIYDIVHSDTHPLRDNYALKNLYTLFNEGGDNMRIFDKNMPTLGIDDMYDSILDLPKEMQVELLLFNIYQAGNSPHPFQLDTILPSDLKFDLIQRVLSTSPDVDFEDFATKFMLNNPKFLPKNKWQANFNNIPFYKQYVDDKLVIYDTTTGSPLPLSYLIEGDYRKVYNTKLGKQEVTQPKTTPVVNTNTGKKNTTVSKKYTWGELKDLPVYSEKGVMVMRKLNTHQHFGNPFTGSGVTGMIQMPDVKTAVQAYKDWLTPGLETERIDFYGIKDNRTLGSINPKQRQWILSQIADGKLDNETLLYMKDKGNYYSHADALADIINEGINQAKPQNDLEFYELHKDTFKAQGITSIDWLDMTEKQKKQLIDKCIK
jgi:hypothetical protein